jgi:transcription termination factor Rho
VPNYHNNGYYANNYSRPATPDDDGPTEMIKGILDTSREGHGVLRVGFMENERDAYISTSQIRRFKLKPGDLVEGPARSPKDNERFWGLLRKINGAI